jgi:uncharacterized protein YjbI with pentapeptide repeats
MRQAQMDRSNLLAANLRKADLKRADLAMANLHRADRVWVDLLLGKLSSARRWVINPSGAGSISLSMGLSAQKSALLTCPLSAAVV